jgi:hypothetical protein
VCWRVALQGGNGQYLSNPRKEETPVNAITLLVVLSLPPLLCPISVGPQIESARSEEDNLYSAALFASLAEMEKACGHIDDG